MGGKKKLENGEFYEEKYLVAIDDQRDVPRIVESNDLDKTIRKKSVESVNLIESKTWIHANGESVEYKREIVIKKRQPKK
jgi:hypothetical protein